MNADEIVSVLAETDTPTLANAIELLEVRNRIDGFCTNEMRQILPVVGAMCGYAVTFKTATYVEETADRAENIDRLIELCRHIQDAPGPVVVVCEETSPRPDLSVIVGEVFATLMRKCGAVGFVTDANVRDIEEIRALADFHLFAAGIAASHGNFTILEVQCPVSVCGLDISPGDLLHGDINGLIKVPQQRMDQLPCCIQKVRDSEGPVLDLLKRDGDLDLEELRRLFVH